MRDGVDALNCIMFYHVRGGLTLKMRVWAVVACLRMVGGGRVNKRLSCWFVEVYGGVGHGEGYNHGNSVLR
jgi:hypothetical protein